jgi:diphthine-ammonia ligase
MTLKAGVLFSGGKDSVYSAFLAKQRDEVTCLVTLNPSRDDSYMFHFPNTHWTALQAEAMHVPQLIVATEGVKEVELNDLSKALQTAKSEYGIEVVYTGALASVYQKSRVDRICAELGLQGCSPLWGIEPREHLLNLINHGFEVIVTGVAALGLDQTWLGRRLDEGMVNDLIKLHDKYQLHAGLEGGEGETFVLDCPLFEKRIEILSAEKHWNGVYGYLEILSATLVDR